MLVNRNTIIVLESVVILVLLFLLFDKPKTITEIKTVEKIVKVTDTVFMSQPQKVIVRKIKVPVYDKDKSSEIVFEQKQTKEYFYIDTLSNGILHARIFSDSIYKRNIKLTTFNKETKINTTNTIHKSNFYVAPSVSFSGMNKVNNVGINGYVAGGKFIIGTGVSVNLHTNQLQYPLTIGYKF